MMESPMFRILCVLTAVMALSCAGMVTAGGFFATPSNDNPSDGEVLLYDMKTGAFLRSVYSSDSTGIIQGMTLGPGGFIYASLFDSGPNDKGRIVRINPFNGASSVFVPIGSGGMQSPRGLRFGPDGNLYVVADKSGEIYRFNGATGAFVDIFADGYGVGQDLVFGPDGRTYMTTSRNGVLRFDSSTGAFVDQFIAPRLSPDAQLFVGLAFAANGDLLVAGFGAGTDSISRYNATTGTLIAEYTDFGISGVDIDTFDVIIGPDENIYVAVRKNEVGGGTDIVRLIGTSGTVNETFTNVPLVFVHGMLIVDEDCAYLSVGPAATKCFPNEFFTVEIDIKPGSDPNCFNINGHGIIPVAILGSEEFDVTQIDVETLMFGGLAVGVRGNKGPLCSIEYTNDDPYPDLVCHFEDSADNWAPGDGEATLTGKLLNGTPFEGSDSICVVP